MDSWNPRCQIGNFDIGEDIPVFKALGISVKLKIVLNLRVWPKTKIDLLGFRIFEEEFLYPWSFPKYAKSISLDPNGGQDTENAKCVVYPGVSFFDQGFKFTEFAENFMFFQVGHTLGLVSIYVASSICIAQNPSFVSVKHFDVVFIILFDIGIFDQPRDFTVGQRWAAHNRRLLICALIRLPIFNGLQILIRLFDLLWLL